jgi:hypothetical protein
VHSDGIPKSKYATPSGTSPSPSPSFNWMSSAARRWEDPKSFKVQLQGGKCNEVGFSWSNERLESWSNAAACGLWRRSRHIKYELSYVRKNRIPIGACRVANGDCEIKLVLTKVESDIAHL